MSEKRGASALWDAQVADPGGKGFPFRKTIILPKPHRVRGTFAGPHVPSGRRPGLALLISCKKVVALRGRTKKLRVRCAMTGEIDDSAG